MKLSLGARLHALEIFWRASLVAIPILILLIVLTPVRGVSLIGIAVALGVIALTAWDYFWGRREVAAMYHDASFNHWLDQVEAQLRQYGVARTDRPMNDWLLDFEAGYTPARAARNFLSHVSANEE